MINPSAGLLNILQSKTLRAALAMSTDLFYQKN
jgi:hypothetical protein